MGHAWRRSTPRRGRRAWRIVAWLACLAAIAVWLSGRLDEFGADAPALGDDLPVSGTWRVVDVIDGDTLGVEQDGVEERVRLLGIDTPERDQCGYAEARDLMATLVGAGDVTLVAGSSDDRDRYGRLLRYVDVLTSTETVDVGLRQLQAGLAAEVYDSRSGYPPHDREAAYVAADDAAPDLCPDLREH